MLVAATAGLFILVFTSLGVYELMSVRGGDPSVPLAMRRRNAMFLIIAAAGALGLCAATASFFSWSSGNDAHGSWEAHEAKLRWEQRIANAGIVMAAISSIIGLVVPRRTTPWALKIAAILPLPLALVWVGLAVFVITGMRIQ